MKVAIIGSNGQLGSDLVTAFSKKHEVLPLNHADIEITDIANVNNVLSSIKPDLVINTAAYHVVPQCEQFADKAFSINSIGVLNLSKVCNDMGAKFLHYSTDYVFDGEKQKPYVEDDYCNPLNVYASSKLSGEHFALNYNDRSYVVRVSGIYGKVPCRAKGGNFITTMMKLAKEKPEVRVVSDEILTPTPTYYIANNTLDLVERDAYGLYHMTCEGEVSWYEFAKTIWQTLGLETPLYEGSVNDFPLQVKRPFYSVLENRNLKEIGCNNMPYWKDALVEFIHKNIVL